MPFTLRALRINKGYSQREAAVLLDITPETLCKWEQAKRFPNVRQISKIEELYDVKYADINFMSDSNPIKPKVR
jgi:transcriptional regulator with XRE-family HTH domain